MSKGAIFMRFISGIVVSIKYDLNKSRGSLMITDPKDNHFVFKETGSSILKASAETIAKYVFIASIAHNLEELNTIVNDGDYDGY